MSHFSVCPLRTSTFSHSRSQDVSKSEANPTAPLTPHSEKPEIEPPAYLIPRTVLSATIVLPRFEAPHHISLSTENNQAPLLLFAVLLLAHNGQIASAVEHIHPAGTSIAEKKRVIFCHFKDGRSKSAAVTTRTGLETIIHHPPPPHFSF